MASYVWEGKTKSGQKKNGEISAANKNEAIEKLANEGLFVNNIRTKSIEINLKLFKQRIKDKNISLFTKGFSVMISSGLTLLDSLEILEDQETNPEFKKVINKIRLRVEGGSTLAYAMSEHERIFSSLYVNLIDSGEKSGTLEDVTKRLSTYLEKTIALKKKVKGAMIYPAIVSSVAASVVALILIVVIPTFESLYGSAGMMLPLPTRIVISLSELLRSYFIYLVLAIIAVVYLLRYSYRKSYRFRKLVDGMILKIPVFGLLIKKSSIARFTRTLGSLMKSGVAVLDGFDLIAKTAGNVIIEEELNNAKQMIAGGSSIAEPMKQSNIFPPMVGHMIAVGEKTGKLDEMLDKTADYYEAEVDDTVANLSTLIEPIVIVFLGTIIGFIVVSMYLPIFELGNVIK